MAARISLLPLLTLVLMLPLAGTAEAAPRRGESRTFTTYLEDGGFDGDTVRNRPEHQSDGAVPARIQRDRGRSSFDSRGDALVIRTRSFVFDSWLPRALFQVVRYRSFPF